MPKFLILHLKRFEYPSLKKDMSLVSYKHALDLSKFRDKEQSAYEPGEEEPSFLFELMGVIIHKGAEMDRGHYLSLAKREKNWYEFDDSRVFEIMGDEYSDHVLDKEAYLLIYKMH